MKFPPLTVIEASAGTGKTFALVTRLLRLVFSGTAPERIVALTFSRLAAGEIFNSFIERLAQAASDAQTAAAESARMGRALSTDDFAAKLREVIARQHLSLIGTLDSFMMRVVRMAPLELGLEGEVSVMSEYRSPVERMRLVGEMMMRETDDAKNAFREAFRLAFGTLGAKGFLRGFAQFIETWHRAYRDAYEAVCLDPRLDRLAYEEKMACLAAGWGDAARIWGEGTPGRDFDVALADVRARADGLSRHAGKRGADTFIAGVRDFVGVIPKLPKCLENEPDACAALKAMQDWKIGAALRATRGVFILTHAYEQIYCAKVRARGLITFDDVPRLLNGLAADVKLPLEYRMDAKFDHWALDEFQDTSRGQWKALENLIDEARQSDEGKSVFVVGDRKQAIYDWRGGDVEIFGELIREAGREGNVLDSLNESWRYVSVISDAVNAVFGESVVRGLVDMDAAPERAKWKCREHKSHDCATVGRVDVIQAEKAGRQSTVSDFFEPIERALNAVRPWERGISTAILVRKNGTGEAILEYLKSKGVSQVVFEGESRVADSPVLTAMTELVLLAEHADDACAYGHVACSPLAAALFPQGLPAPAALSARLLDDFTRMGMVRKFREVREALKAIPGTWNDFTESRFEDFVKCAAEFEEMRDATMRLSDFAEFLSHKMRRDFAEPGRVRIMSMHQSKGLGFDWVIIPFYEPEKMIGERHPGALEHENPDWILDNPGAAVNASDAVLAAAERAQWQDRIYAALCLDYVAMTRAKRALTLILNPANAKAPPTPEKFSDLVRQVGLTSAGDPRWYEKFVPAGDGEKTSAAARLPFVRPPRRAVKKSRPSESFYSGLRGDALFREDFGKAAQRGREIHARYEAVEWIEASQARNALERALVKGAYDATLWRERSYELFVDGKWETGQFDRVVFGAVDGERTATIFDFKTNARRAGESEADFAARMRETYAGQLGAYRRALAVLVGMPAERIKTVLLLESTGAAVEI